MLHRLTRAFFEQNTPLVAKKLIGKTLNFNAFKGIITETEAYCGEEDPACHAAKGLTPRTQIMYGAAGYSYVYFIYGMYHCLNVVTEPKETPSAVLIRGIQLLDGQNSHLDGPGKICRNLGITKQKHNGIDLTNHPSFYFSKGIDVDPSLIKETPRIGVSKGKDKLWRYAIDAPLKQAR